MRSIVFAALLVLASAAVAQQSGAVKVTGYVPYESGANKVLIFQIQGMPSGGCNTTGRLAISSANPKFNGTQAAIMAAYHTQSDVQVSYSQVCNSFYNAWDANFVCVGNMPC